MADEGTGSRHGQITSRHAHDLVADLSCGLRGRWCGAHAAASLCRNRSPLPRRHIPFLRRERPAWWAHRRRGRRGACLAARCARWGRPRGIAWPNDRGPRDASLDRRWYSSSGPVRGLIGHPGPTLYLGGACDVNQPGAAGCGGARVSACCAVWGVRSVPSAPHFPSARGVRVWPLRSNPARRSPRCSGPVDRSSAHAPRDIGARGTHAVCCGESAEGFAGVIRTAFPKVKHRRGMMASPRAPFRYGWV